MLPLMPLVQGLLSQGLGLLGNAVLAKGKEWVEEKAGVKLAEEMPPEVLVKLKEFELTHERELLQLRLEDNKLDLEVFKAELADKQSARQREVEMQRLSKAPWWVPSTLTLLTFLVVGGGGLMLQDAESEDLRYALIAAITMVLTYYFGTTASSARNGQAMRELLKGDAK